MNRTNHPQEIVMLFLKQMIYDFIAPACHAILNCCEYFSRNIVLVSALILLEIFINLPHKRIKCLPENIIIRVKNRIHVCKAHISLIYFYYFEKISI